MSLAAVESLCTAACVTTPSGPRWAAGDPSAIVSAVTETVVETDPEVAADHPALWADASNSTRAVMFGTDKSGGLYVHDLEGSVRQFLPSGAVNNVDLRTGQACPLPCPICRLEPAGAFALTARPTGGLRRRGQAHAL
jgi:3-phytase